MSIRLWAANRPVLALIVRGRPILLPVRTLYIVRHPRFALWWRDPWQLRTNAGDPRSDWGPRERAYRFGSTDAANHALATNDVAGIIEPL